jgi:predicted GNAT superfamily acetyltransferase
MLMADRPITFRELRTPDEMRGVVELQKAVWGPDDPTPAHQLLMSVKTGGHVIGTYADDVLVAFVYGFAAVLPGKRPWIASHMLATRAGWEGRGLGRRLKWLQREWALAHGFARITWTFDPLEARNAHLNLNVLGATAPEFLPNCYGTMDDRLNRGLPSDRLMADWDLESPRVEEALEHELRLPEDASRQQVLLSTTRS